MKKITFVIFLLIAIGSKVIAQKTYGVAPAKEAEKKECEKQNTGEGCLKNTTSKPLKVEIYNPAGGRVSSNVFGEPSTYGNPNSNEQKLQTFTVAPSETQCLTLKAGNWKYNASNYETIGAPVTYEGYINVEQCQTKTKEIK